MPTCFVVDGMRFFFYSDDHEPIHIHVSKGKGSGEVQAKFQVIPNTFLIENYGLPTRDINKAKKIILERADEIIAKWQSHFNKL